MSFSNLSGVPQLAKDVERLKAEVEAQQLVTEVLVHGLFSEFTRTQLLAGLEIAYRELAVGLGENNGVVLAFAEQQDRLRSLLVTSPSHVERLETETSTQ
jgi:hypothetical protein